MIHFRFHPFFRGDFFRGFSGGFYRNILSFRCEDWWGFSAWKGESLDIFKAWNLNLYDVFALAISGEGDLFLGMVKSKWPLKCWLVTSKLGPRGYKWSRIESPGNKCWAVCRSQKKNPVQPAPTKTRKRQIFFFEGLLAPKTTLSFWQSLFFRGIYDNTSPPKECLRFRRKISQRNYQQDFLASIWTPPKIGPISMLPEFYRETCEPGDSMRGLFILEVGGHLTNPLKGHKLNHQYQKGHELNHQVYIYIYICLYTYVWTHHSGFKKAKSSDQSSTWWLGIPRQFDLPTCGPAGRGCESRESQLYDCQRGFEATVKTLEKKAKTWWFAKVWLRLRRKKWMVVRFLG